MASSTRSTVGMPGGPPVMNAPSWFADSDVSLTSSPDPEGVGELRRRQAKLREKLRYARAGAIVTMRQVSIRYLTGYSTVASGKAAVVVTGDGAYLAVAESELGRAVVTPAVDGVYVFGWDEPVDVDRWLGESEWTRDCGPIIREQDGSIVGTFGPEARRLPAVPEHVAMIDRLRLTTSDWEAARMRLAALATKAGVEAALTEADRADATDADMAAAAMAAMVRQSGYEFPAFVVAGVDEGGGVPHSPWRRRALDPGSVAFLEFSGGFDGYCAPVMRTIAREPVSDDVVFLFDRVEAILETLYEEMRPGIRCSDIAARCTAQLSGVEDLLFHYNYGYPVGIFDDQSPSSSWMTGTDFHVTVENDGVLEAGMTFHLPISLRRFGRYAVGQSQTVRVVEDGVEILTSQVPAGLLRVQS